MKSYFEAFLSLFFPRVCFNCSTSLVHQEEVLCMHCYLSLSRTNYHKEPSNQFLNGLNTLTRLSEAFAMLKYGKKSIAQKLIHGLKYKNQKSIGSTLGEWMGRDISDHQAFDYDLIVPVPLHPKKERQRGYNQATVLAEGVSRILETPVAEKMIKRTRFANSQAKKGRIKRWAESDSLYAINQKVNLSGKNILIVDDVITTGATVSQIANILLENGAEQVSVACLATGK